MLPPVLPIKAASRLSSCDSSGSLSTSGSNPAWYGFQRTSRPNVLAASFKLGPVHQGLHRRSVTGSGPARSGSLNTSLSERFPGQTLHSLLWPLLQAPPPGLQYPPPLAQVRDQTHKGPGLSDRLTLHPSCLYLPLAAAVSRWARKTVTTINEDVSLAEY